MRTLVTLLLSLAAACAGPGTATRARGVALSDDGRTAIVGGETWRAPEGIAFFQRGSALHLVSLVPGSVCDVTLEIGPDGRAQLPASSPFEVKEGTLRLRERPAAPASRLVESGQLYRHDDHFHLTHLWENADWRALYRDREESSSLSPVSRNVAAVALTTLLDLRLAGGSETATEHSMRRVEAVVARARRSVEAQLPAKQIMAMVQHDFEIADDGRTLFIEGTTYRAADGVRFTYCGDHFHVEGTATPWVHPISLAAAEPGAFALPASMFYEVANGAVAERSGPTPWRDLLAREQIQLTGDGWYVTERYAFPAFARLQQASRDPSLPAQLRDEAWRSVLEVLRIRLDLDGDAELRARLASIEQVVETRWKELEAQIPAAKVRKKN